MFGNLFKSETGKKGKNQSSAEGLTTEPTTSVSSDSSNSSYTKFNLGTPPKGSKPVSLKKAKKRMKNDGFGKYLKTKNEGSDETKMLIFLYGRGCFKDDKKDNRTEKIMKMVSKNKERSGEEGPKDRLMRVLAADGDRDITVSHNKLRCKNKSILEHYFAQDGAFGFLEDMSQANYFFRIQKSGNCFLQAPCVMLAYLAQKHKIKQIVGPVDVSKYIRRSFCDDDLYKYIVKDGGGSSQDILRDIVQCVTGQEPEIDSYCARGVRSSGFNLEGKLSECGPALLSGFTVHHKFGKSANEGRGYFRFNGECGSQGQFVKVPAGEEEIREVAFELEQDNNSLDESQPRNAREEDGAILGKHAMVLIGGRIDHSTNTKWLLFQNWWKHMQFVEISDKYLVNCGGNLTFVNDGRLGSCINISALYSMNKYQVAESNNLEKADSGRNASSRMNERLNFHA